MSFFPDSKPPAGSCHPTLRRAHIARARPPTNTLRRRAITGILPLIKDTGVRHNFRRVTRSRDFVGAIDAFRGYSAGA